jgi:small-conductance mechanosensitive channel
MRRAVLLLAAELTLNTAAAGQSAPPAPAPVRSSDIVSHLERTLAWYRRVSAVDQQPEITSDLASRDRVHQAALKALQLAFDFARAEAALFRRQPGGRQPGGRQPAGAPSPPQETAAGATTSFEQASAQLAARATTLQARLNEVDSALQQASERTRGPLLDERAVLVGDLDLTRTIQESVGSILQFASTSAFSERSTDALTARINELARTVPEVGHITRVATATSAGASGSPPGNPPPRPGNPAASGPPADATQTSAPGGSALAFRPGSAGLLALFTELFTTVASRREVDDVLGQTEALTQSIEERRAPLTGEADALVREGDVAASATADRTQVAEVRRNLQTAVARVKQLSTAIVPLGEQAIAVDTARAGLVMWRNGLTERSRVEGRYVLMRTLLLVAVIAVLLALSEAWRRATFRYLRDARKRAQLLLLRRVVVGSAIGIVILIAFASEVGSLATYAGFVTAGLAVALQNVILAVVAYFFLIGRYGVRVGDQVTIAGVTGKVVEIGLVRIYLMELAGPDWRPTGRIVVFSNSVLFQPSALFKQTPGVDYVWRTVTLTLVPDTNVAHAEEELARAVDAVYEQYRDRVDQQHATLQRTLDVQTPVPRPEAQARYTPEGVELSIRYPVERSQTRNVDLRVMTAIRDAIASDASIRLVASGGPRVAPDLPEGPG